MKATTMYQGSIRHRSFRKLATGTLVAGAMALALAGCGSGASSHSGGGNGGGGGTPTTAPSTGGTSF